MACNGEQKNTNTNLNSGEIVTKTNQHKTGIELQNMDLSVRPQDDFFTYVNGKWVEKTKIPADKPSWGAFNELRELTDDNSLILIKELLKQSPEIGSEAQKIKTTYEAFSNFDERNTNGLTSLNDDFFKINQVTNLAELQKVIIDLGKEGTSNPFYDWYVYSDMKDSQNNAVYQTGGLILLPRDYYQKKSARNDEVIKKYKSFVAQVLERLDYSNADKLAEDIVQFEQKIADNLLTNEEIRDATLQYNPRSVSQLNHISKNVDLNQFLSGVAVNTGQVIVDEIKYFNKLDEYSNEGNLELLKAYYKYWLVVNNHDVLDEAMDNTYFEFFNQFLQGQKEQRQNDKKGLDFINRNLGEPFGKVYVSKYFSEESKRQMLELIDYLKKNYRQHIRNLTWMGDETKQKALHKLDKLAVKVGYPDKWKDFSQLDIKPDEKNIFNIKSAINKWNYQEDLKKVGQKVDKTEWAMPPQTVNAYYSPMKHEIVFPAAILQSPFFNSEVDPAVNFGGIGGVIAHEITHGFDDSGAMFDADGNLNNWWTEEDKSKFDALTQKMVGQFNQYEVVPGHFINGKFTLGENIADLGGVNLAFDALQAYLKDKNIPQKSNDDSQSFTENQKFFISWASVWRTKSTTEYLQNQVKVDPHSPGQFRAFAPLTNVDAFYKAFDVQSGDKLYKAPEDRIKIW
ncbi:M13 family peptidase [Neisseriaceae bacterium PsAf]|nr:M13 family peptidase [Neisseriaceae bacterium PsAf]